LSISIILRAGFALTFCGSSLGSLAFCFFLLGKRFGFGVRRELLSFKLLQASDLSAHGFKLGIYRRRSWWINPSSLGSFHPNQPARLCVGQLNRFAGLPPLAIYFGQCC